MTSRSLVLGRGWVPKIFKSDARDRWEDEREEFVDKIRLQEEGGRGRERERGKGEMITLASSWRGKYMYVRAPSKPSI